MVRVNTEIVADPLLEPRLIHAQGRESFLEARRAAQLLLNGDHAFGDRRLSGFRRRVALHLVEHQTAIDQLREHDIRGIGNPAGVGETEFDDAADI